MDWLLGEKAGLRDLYAKKLDPLLVPCQDKLRKLIVEHAKIKSQKYGTADEHDYFRYAYHYTVENAPNHLQKMQNYVALYGFLRTLITGSGHFLGSCLARRARTFAGIQSVGLLALSILVSYVTFMAFVKFYRRFSLEALRRWVPLVQSQP